MVLGLTKSSFFVLFLRRAHRPVRSQLDMIQYLMDHKTGALTIDPTGIVCGGKVTSVRTAAFGP